MVRRLAALAAAFLLLPAAAFGDIAWKQDTGGQRLLRQYVETANAYLLGFGEQPVNSLFEMYTSLAVLGITAQEGAEVPEEVEITFTLSVESLNTLQVRVSRPERFPAVAAAFLLALSPDMTPEAALKEPQDRARRALQNPDNSFEEPVDDLNGTSSRVYYAYFPDQYHDGVNWIQMTLVFPLPEYWNSGEMMNGDTATPAPKLPEDADPEFEGYESRDDYSHLEVFTTETPEPDSAAREYDSVWK